MLFSFRAISLEPYFCIMSNICNTDKCLPFDSMTIFHKKRKFAEDRKHNKEDLTPQNSYNASNSPNRNKAGAETSEEINEEIELKMKNVPLSLQCI